MMMIHGVCLQEKRFNDSRPYLYGVIDLGRVVTSSHNTGIHKSSRIVLSYFIRNTPPVEKINSNEIT